MSPGLCRMAGTPVGAVLDDDALTQLVHPDDKERVADPGIVDRIVAILADTSRDPRAISFEATETALMGDEDVALAALAALRRLGAESEAQLAALRRVGGRYAQQGFLWSPAVPVERLRAVVGPSPITQRAAAPQGGG